MEYKIGTSWAITVLSIPEGLPCWRDSVLNTICDISSFVRLYPRYLIIHLEMAVEMDALDPRPDAIGMVDVTVRLPRIES